MKNLKLASREQEKRTIVNVGGVEVGRDLVVIAGPCSVESEVQAIQTAHAVKAAGADGLIIEVHNNPAEALCDADQALTPEMFSGIMAQVRPLKAFLENR